MKREYDGFRLTRLAPESAMSAASITKAFLDEMHVKEPAQKFQLPNDVLGKCLHANGRKSSVWHDDEEDLPRDTTLVRRQ